MLKKKTAAQHYFLRSMQPQPLSVGLHTKPSPINDYRGEKKKKKRERRKAGREVLNLTP